MTTRTQTRTEDVTHYGIALRLYIKEKVGPREEGFPHGTIEAGRVVAAEVLEVVDEVQAYKNLSQLKGG